MFSFFYLRKWTVALATEITLEVLSSLFATVYMRAWYRLMGAKIGKDAEISTNLSGRYDLVENRREMLHRRRGGAGRRGGARRLDAARPRQDRPARLHRQRRRGADRVRDPEGALIGIKSKPPANAALKPGDTWFGTPPIRLPVRQRFDGGANWTYEAPAWKKFTRAVFEAVHISLPTMLFIVAGTWSVQWLAPRIFDGLYVEVALLFVLLSLLISVTMTLIVVGVKWATMGRYEPTTQPMWSFWAMRTEAVAVMYWGLAGRVLLEHLMGTPFLPWVLRLLRARFGRECG